MRSLIIIGILVLMTGLTSGINYFGLLNSSDEYTDEEIFEGLDMGNEKNNVTEFDILSKPMSETDKQLLGVLIVFIVLLAWIVFYYAVNEWEFGGRHLP